MKRHRPYMPSLFDPGPEAILNVAEGKVLRDAGIKQAIDHADEVISDWQDRAYSFLLNFLANHNGTFMCEDVRVYSEEMGLPEPPSNRAWGHVMVRGKANNLIESWGTKKVKNKKAHRANANLWMQKRKR